MEKAILLEVLEGGKIAKVKTYDGQIIDNVVMLFPYGESSNPPIDGNSLIFLLYSLTSRSNLFGIPYNVPLQSALEPTEKQVGNFSVGNKVTFKANGDLEITGTNDFLAESLANLNINATTKITLNAPDVSLGDAVGLVLNDAASMQVVISGGSSAGTYPVTIVSAGQTKVKA